MVRVFPFIIGLIKGIGRSSASGRQVRSLLAGAQCQAQDKCGLGVQFKFFPFRIGLIQGFGRSSASGRQVRSLLAGAQGRAQDQNEELLSNTCWLYSVGVQC